jgi:hypothetical protein
MISSSGDFIGFCWFSNAVDFEINLLDKYLHSTLKDFHKYIGRIDIAEN